VASATKKYKIVRKRKARRMGNDRKTAEARNGTTPSRAAFFGDDAAANTTETN